MAQINSDNNSLNLEELLITPVDREDAIEVTPARAAMYEGMVDIQDENFDVGIPKLEWAIEEDPTLIAAWETLGWAYWVTNRRQDAEALWRRLATIAPNEPMAYNLLAQVATRDGDFERAEELYRTSLRLNPDQYEIRLNLARVLLWGGRTQLAVDLLRRLIHEDPDRIDVEIELAWALFINEEYEAAIERWDRVNEEIPDMPTFLLARANTLILLGALDEAEDDALHVLELEPSNREAINILANLAVRTRRPQEAVAALQDLIDHTEDDESRGSIALQIAVYINSLLTDGSDLFSRRDVLRWVSRALEYDDQSMGALLYYGEILIADRQFVRAHQIFEHVLDEFNPFTLRALLGKLETYFGRSMWEEAEQMIRRISNEFNPNNPFRHALYARLHFARGDLHAALDSLDRLEFEGSQGAVFSLLYHGISPSEFSEMPSARQLREHLMTLRRDGFRFITPSEIPGYFEQKQPAPLTDERPWLNRLVQAIRRSWTGTAREEVQRLSDYAPEKVVLVTFDDGLRNSFRYGTEVALDLNIPMTMFVGVGDVVSGTQRYIASFSEIRDFHSTGMWEIHSHLWDAGEPAPTGPDGRLHLPISNRLWLPSLERQETLREYQARLRREFRDSRRVLARELHLESEDIIAVAYPLGDVGQENASNIRAFRVPDVVLNEAEISYQLGFIQHQNGYTMKTDDPMLYKRYEPSRNATGRDVLRAAYRQHPVFTARRMRAEMAALNGRLHLAMDNIELLRRDGYPEEDLAELREYVRRHLARLTALPEPTGDITGSGREPLISLRHPYVGIHGSIMRANEMIDEREISVYAGFRLNRRVGLEARVGQGQIKQTIRTNNFVEVEQVTVTSETVTQRRVVEVEQVTVTSDPAAQRRIEDGEVTNETIERTSVSTELVLSNQVTSSSFAIDTTRVGLMMNYTHDAGSFTVAEIFYHTWDGGEIDSKNFLSYGIEHQWRPIPAIDLIARYHHSAVPSARQVIEYDSLALRPIWRIRDGWEAMGLGYFAYYEDKNSFLKTELENFWCLSHRNDVWFGVRHSLDTVDRDSDLYWTPFWDQRHTMILRIRRSYPNYYGMVRMHLGMQKNDVRQEDRDAYEAARAQGAAQGWSPGSNPQRGWKPMLGFEGSVSRSFQSGLEISADFSVNSTDEYTEHTARINALFVF